MWLQMYKNVAFGGNSYGVCRGLDQGGKLQNKKHLSQDFTYKAWAFILVIDETPECVITSDQNMDEKVQKE